MDIHSGIAIALEKGRTVVRSLTLLSPLITFVFDRSQILQSEVTKRPTKDYHKEREAFSSLAIRIVVYTFELELQFFSKIVI